MEEPKKYKYEPLNKLVESFDPESDFLPEDILRTIESDMSACRQVIQGFNSIMQICQIVKDRLTDTDE